MANLEANLETNYEEIVGWKITESVWVPVS